MNYARFALAMLATTGVATIAAAMPATAPDGSNVEQAISVRDYPRAIKDLNALTAARLPAAEPNRPDPVLDRLFAEIASAGGAPASAAPLLERLTADHALPNRPHYLLLLANAHEDAGRLDDAEQEYRVVTTESAAAGADRLAATLGLARLGMTRDPEAALTALAAARPDAASTWEVDLERARASFLAARDADGRAALDRAWTEATAAGPDQYAAARVSADMAVDAGIRGERDRLIAMLAVDRLNRGPNAGQQVLAGNVPICGGGIRPDDSVAVAFLRQAPPGRPRFSLVRASRASVARAFLLAVARDPAITVSDGSAAAIVLRCRVGPSPDYRVRIDLDDRVVTWTTSRGAYPLIEDDEQADDPSVLAAALADRERRYGSGSVMLVPVLVRIVKTSLTGGLTSKEARARAAALVHRAVDILVSNHAPTAVTLSAQLSAITLDIQAQVTAPEAAQTEFQALLTQAASDSSISLDTLYAVAIAFTDTTQSPSALRAAVLEQVSATLRGSVGSDDPRVRALALRLVNVRREQGDAVAVAALVKQSGFAPDLCGIAPNVVRFTASRITADDYPSDLVQAQLQGRSMLEMDVAATGIGAATRLLVSDPPYAFDAVTAAKTALLSFEPAKSMGIASRCHGQTSAIRWQFPD